MAGIEWSDRMADDGNRNIKSNIIMAFISIAATILVGWITIKISSDKSLEAAYEREIKVKESLVRIVEQNILNQTPLDGARLRRLIETKSLEQKINLRFQPIEIVKNAELNLLLSDHLDPNRKELIKTSFDSIYKNLSIWSKIVGSDSNEYRNQVLIDKINASIQSGQVNESSNNINELIEFYNSKIETLRSEKHSILQDIAPDSRKVYLYLQMFQIVLLVSSMYIFALKGREWLGDVDYSVYRKIKRALMVLTMMSLIPFYLITLLRMYIK